LKTKIGFIITNLLFRLTLLIDNDEKTVYVLKKDIKKIISNERLST